MELTRAVGENIKRIRKGKKLSMERLAAEAGVSRSMLGQIERGEANPSVGLLGKLASALKVPAEELLENDDFQPLLELRELDNKPVRLDGGKVLLRPSEPYDDVLRQETFFLDLYISGRYEPEPMIPGCVCLAAFIFDNKLIYGSAGDCMGMLVRGNQTMVFSQKQTTYAFDYLKKEKDRDLLMKSYVNCPENEFGYGVANGDERAKNCFRVSHIDLERGDAVYLVTDGLSDVIQYFKGATINAMSLEEISECAERQAAELGKPYCDDRTIVRIVIDSIKATPEQPENKAMKAG